MIQEHLNFVHIKHIFMIIHKQDFIETEPSEEYILKSVTKYHLLSLIQHRKKKDMESM